MVPTTCNEQVPTTEDWDAKLGSRTIRIRVSNASPVLKSARLPYALHSFASDRSIAATSFDMITVFAVFALVVVACSGAPPRLAAPDIPGINSPLPIDPVVDIPDDRYLLDL